MCLIHCLLFTICLLACGALLIKRNKWDFLAGVYFVFVPAVPIERRQRVKGSSPALMSFTIN